MQEVMTLRIALVGRDDMEILRAVVDSGLFGQGQPDELRVGGKRIARIPKNWLQKHGGDNFRVTWGDAPEFMVSNSFGEIVKIHSKSFPRDASPLVDFLADLPFSVASFSSIHEEWWGHYDATGFGGLHYPHGVACAFKGEGHDQLVSRRWLEFGPWRTLTGPNDTTLVQFHDLDADSATARAQAEPGHNRMGVSDEGGFIAADHECIAGLGGRYYPADHRQKIMAGLREVSEREMLDACAARRDQHWGADRPSEHVGFIFMEEKLARRHLHELWLRELECWGVVNGQDQRLDTEYHATPDPPAWVRALGSD